MTTATSTTAPAHPRTRSMESWRSSLGAMASRGERTGARVEEAKAALRWWGHRSHLIKAGATEGGADQLADLIAQHELLDQHAEFDADQHAAAESAAEQVDTAESTAEAVAP